MISYETYLYSVRAVLQDMADHFVPEIISNTTRLEKELDKALDTIEDLQKKTEDYKTYQRLCAKFEDLDSQK